MSRVWVALGCVLVFVMMASPGVVSATESPWDGPAAFGPSDVIPFDDPAFARGRDAALAAQLAGDREWASESAREARRVSRSAFAGLGGADALALAQREFAQWLSEPLDDLGLRSGDRVTGLKSETSATVITSAGKRSLLVSSQPLATREGTKLVEVDLSLERTVDGDLEPATPAVETELPARADVPATVGESGLAVRPQGAAGVAGIVAENRVFYPSIATDTDYVATPTRSGLEVMWQLRSADAPQRLGLDIDLPAGATMRLASTVTGPGSPGVLEVVSDGKVINTISAPVAIDADGRNVPAVFAFQDGVVGVEIDHSGRDVRYPVLVDPEVREVWGGYDFNGSCGGGPTNFQPGRWSYGQTASFTGFCGDVYGSGSAGLFLRSEAINYADGQTAYWAWSPPAGSYIAGAWFDGLRHTAAGTYLYTGLTGSGAWGSLVFHPSEFFYGQYSQAPDSAFRSWTAILGLSISGSYPRPHIGLGGVRGVNLLLGDLDPPTVRLAGITGNLNGQGQSAWTDDQLVYNTATVSGVDGGLGLKKLSVVRDVTGAVIGETTHGCAGYRSSPCPKNWSSNFPLYLSQLPEGHTAIQTRATDIADRNGYGPHWTQRIDRTPPQIHLSGELVDHATDGQLPANPSLSIHATDGADSSPVTQRSGVKRIRVLLDGQVVQDNTNPATTCDSCPRGQTWSVSVTEFGSEAEVRVEAWDYLGHRAVRTIRVLDPAHPDFEPSGGVSVVREEFVPDDGGPVQDLTDLEAGTSAIRVVYTPSDQTGFRSNHTGALSTRARFVSPINFQWSYELSSRVRSMSMGSVTERAAVYTYPKGRKINYSDFHVVPVDYLFHSTVTAIGIGSEYRLQINFTMPARSGGSVGTWRGIVRQNFLMALV